MIFLGFRAISIMAIVFRVLVKTIYRYQQKSVTPAGIVVEIWHDKLLEI